jgi:predicted CxxxxCH...CXXCH cytochrome family protein
VGSSENRLSGIPVVRGLRGCPRFYYSQGEIAVLCAAWVNLSGAPLRSYSASIAPDTQRLVGAFDRPLVVARGPDAAPPARHPGIGKMQNSDPSKTLTKWTKPLLALSFCQYCQGFWEPEICGTARTAIACHSRNRSVRGTARPRPEWLIHFEYPQDCETCRERV